MLCLRVICWQSHDSASSNPRALDIWCRVVTFHNIPMLCSSRYQKGHAYFTRKFKRNSWKYGIIPEVFFVILYYALFCNLIQERLRAPHPLPHLFHLSALPPTGNQAFNEVSGGGVSF